LALLDTGFVSPFDENSLIFSLVRNVVVVCEIDFLAHQSERQM